MSIKLNLNIFKIFIKMEQTFDELIRIYRNWNKEWKKNQSLRHENWEMRNLDKKYTSFEEKLHKRVQWEKGIKYREWKKYRLKIEKKILSNMSQEEILCLRKYIKKMNRNKDRV